MTRLEKLLKQSPDEIAEWFIDHFCEAMGNNGCKGCPHEDVCKSDNGFSLYLDEEVDE